MTHANQNRLKNIWKNNLLRSIETIKKIKRKVSNDRLIISSSCSLLHSPIDLNKEESVDTRIKDWLSFADQKLTEESPKKSQPKPSKQNGWMNKDDFK